LRVGSLISNGTGQPAFMGRRQVVAAAVVILVALSFRRIKARGSVNAKGGVHLSRAFASANVKETACVSPTARPAIHAVSLAARFAELECRLTTRIRCSCLKRSSNQRCSLGKWQHDQPRLHALGLLLADGWLKICPLSASRITWHFAARDQQTSRSASRRNRASGKATLRWKTPHFRRKRRIRWDCATPFL